MRVSPLVIFGFDAGDPGFLVHWAQEGYLPTLASIMERGCWSETGGPELLSEHGVWAIIFRGVSRGALGYYYFRQLQPGTYDLVPVTGLDLKVPPFWAHLRSRGKKVAIIDAPDCYPVPSVDGIQLSNWAPHLGWETRHPAYLPQAEPKSLLQQVGRAYGKRKPILEKADSTTAEDRHIYHQLLGNVRKKGNLCRNLLAQGQYDLTVIVFSESHTAGHQFWRYRPEAPPSGKVSGTEELTHAIRDVYRAIDHELGLLLAELPRESNVFVLSSIGMEDYCPVSGMAEALCRRLEYLTPLGPTKPSYKPMEVIRRFVPEPWRVALSRYLPRDTRERLLAEQFRRSADWSRTKAFALPSPYNGLIRVNLRGREPQGIVNPGREYEGLLDRLEEDFRNLVDPVTGGAAVKEILRPGVLFDNSPPVVFPDLWVRWHPANHFRQRLVHPKGELEISRPEWFRCSDHSHNGFVAAAGPSVHARGRMKEVSLLDLPPTFLALLGEPTPGELTGRVIGELVDA